MKRMFSLFLAICLMLSLVPAVQVQAAEDITVYWDPEAGDDSADGLTEAAAVQSYDTAYAKIKAAGGGTIVALSTKSITADTPLPSSASTVPVVLTSKTGAEGISANTNVRFNAPTTLQNITMTLTKESGACVIYGEGKKLTIGENVNSVGPGEYRFCLAGGRRWYYSTASTDLTVQSGTWRNVYVGTYGSKKTGGTEVSKVTGNAKFTMTGGTLTGFITPAYSSSAVIGGNVDIYLSNMSAATIYSAPVYTATVGGDVNITLGEGAVITGSVFTGGLGSGSVTGNVNITLDGADTTGYDRIKNGGSSDFTGTIGGATVTLKSGVITNTISGFDNVAVDIPEGKTLTINKYSVTADTVQSAGTLAFKSTGTLTAKAVTGTVNCAIADELLNNHAYITAPAGSGFVFEDDVLTEDNGVWINKDLENFQGLVLSYDEGVTVTLYSGFGDTTIVEPYHTENNTNYYASVSGKYRVVAKRTGYITMSENIYVSDEETTTRMEKHYSLVEREKAWDPEYVRKLTDEALASLPADKSQWPQYAAAFTSPVFTEGRSMHKYTTQQEMEDFIAGLDTADDKMYVYSLGTTQGTKKFNIPLVIFTETDLSGAETLEEAAALVNGNGKLTVHYQGQVHGNEPAGGEAALGMIAMMDTEYGDKLLDKLNVYIIPRLNPDGAYQDKRVIPNVSLDPNRDYTNLKTYEVRRTVYAMNLFHPEAVVDGHEYTVNLDSSSIGHRDILIHSERSAYSTDDFVTQADNIGKALFASMEENGMTYGWYNNYLGGASSNIGTSYTMQRGYYSVLLESYGIWGGTYNMARRVAAHVSAMDGVLQYLHENADAANKAVNDQWNTIIENGKKYGDGDQMTLKVTSQPYPSLNVTNAKTLNLATGEITSTTSEAKAVTLVTRSRENATAYLVPADHEQIDYILEHVAAHGLTYYKIPAYASVTVQHVGGDTTEAVISEEQKTVFENGAYVFGMDQRYARNLAFLMEPDVNQNAEYSSSFAQAGIFTLENGEYPVYRYVRDLNADSKIDYEVIPAAPEGLAVTVPTDGNNGIISGLNAEKLYEYRLESETEYTAVPAGSTQITGLAEGIYYVRFQAAETVPASADAVHSLYVKVTVYLDQTNGSDDNDGYTEATAVATLNKAYAQLAARLTGDPEDKLGTIMFLSEYTFTVKNYNFPSHDFPVVLTSKTGAEGMTYTYKSGTVSTHGEWNLNGPTTFRNITLTNSGDDTYVFLAAGGHKLVIESDVTVPESGYRFMLTGGRRSGTSTNSDMTVAGGRFDVIYLGSRSGTHTGPINFTMTGGNTNTLTQSHDGSVTGDINIHLENARVGNAYMGNASKGNVTGNVTVTLGEGLTGTAVYAGSRDSGNVTGKVTVIADGIDLTAIPVYGKGSKSTNTGTIGGLKLVVKKGELADVADTFVTRDGVDIVLGCDQTKAATLNYSCNLDLNGCDATITVADGKTLTVCDTATDDFKVLDAQGYGILTATGTVTPKEGYVVREETAGKSYHRRELKLDNVVLRPSATGIYYTGQFGLNELYRGNVESYGVVLSLDPDPILGKDGCAWTVLTQWPDTGAGYGTVLQGIMTQNGGYSSNKANAERVVYGVAYIKYTDGTVEYSNYAQCTLRQVVEASDAIWNDLTQPQKEGLLAMYGDFAKLMRSWNIPNIKSAA